MGIKAAIVGVLAITTPACAQDRMMEALARAKKSHNDCFYNSAAAQLEAINPKMRRQADINMIAEQSFQACVTEEQMLAAIVTTRIRGQEAQVALLGNRTTLKRDLNNLFKYPERYAR